MLRSLAKHRKHPQRASTMMLSCCRAPTAEGGHASLQFRLRQRANQCFTGVFLFMLSENLKWKNTKLSRTTVTLVILVCCKTI